MQLNYLFYYYQLINNWSTKLATPFWKNDVVNYLSIVVAMHFRSIWLPYIILKLPTIHCMIPRRWINCNKSTTAIKKISIVCSTLCKLGLIYKRGTNPRVFHKILIHRIVIQLTWNPIIWFWGRQPDFRRNKYSIILTVYYIFFKIFRLRKNWMFSKNTSLKISWIELSKSPSTP